MKDDGKLFYLKNMYRFRRDMKGTSVFLFQKPGHHMFTTCLWKEGSYINIYFNVSYNFFLRTVNSFNSIL